MDWQRRFVAFTVVGTTLGWLVAVGCADGGGCVREVRCVTACGQPSQTAGCGPCPSGTFDDYTCPADAGASDGGGADGG